MSEPVLIDMDELGWVSLGRLHPAAGPDVGMVEPDGTIVLRPAAVMTVSQARLLARPELMDDDALAVDPDSWSQGGRPRRR